LIQVDGTLYGTTEGGGNGDGTVFSFDPATRTETTLYSFCSQQNCTDGKWPFAALIDVKGMLYGTTLWGGAKSCINGCGTVFSLDARTGAETVLHFFCGSPPCIDGAQPYAGLIEVNGVLYGTTYEGDSQNGGTVFAVDPTTGAETVVYSFCSRTNCEDGAKPRANLIEANGMLYGTTFDGEIDGCDAAGGGGCGTVFSIDPNTGTETVLHAFRGSKHGAKPFASSLVGINGTLYGTTFYGGTKCRAIGCGTVFSFELGTGKEGVVHFFCSRRDCEDGQYPYAGLLKVKDTLYGTTILGGDERQGVIFALKEP
jgi:uncharacterized repeat protein (TIGR03803 family)